MSELNFELLQENIRVLLKKHNLTQSELAAIVSMSQGNLSKALNPDEKKQLTLEQLFRISQHFGVSIDELVGNRAANEVETGPRAALAFITKLLCESKLRHTTVEAEEWVYECNYIDNNYREFECKKKTIEYPAFYFADYQRYEDFARKDILLEDIECDFCQCGNDTKFQRVNNILKDFLPVVRLYRETQIPDEAFQMILKGYLEQLSEK